MSVLGFVTLCVPNDTRNHACDYPYKQSDKSRMQHIVDAIKDGLRTLDGKGDFTVGDITRKVKAL